jgi:hypothetical protein
MADDEAQNRVAWKAVIVGTFSAIVVGVAVYWLTVGIGGSPDRPTNGGSSSAKAAKFTVEDAEYHGTWALARPDGTRLAPRNEMPTDAKEWLAEGTAVTISCAHRGTDYGVINQGRHETWRWWAKLADGRWIAMAALRQATLDGSQGFDAC